MIPAAFGITGHVRVSFGNYMHRGWVGAGYLVARAAEEEFGASRRIAAVRRGLRTGGERVQDVSEIYYDPYDSDIDADPYPITGGCATRRRSTTTSTRLLRGEPVRRRGAVLKDRSPSARAEGRSSS